MARRCPIGPGESTNEDRRSRSRLVRAHGDAEVRAKDVLLRRESPGLEIRTSIYWILRMDFGSVQNIKI